MGRPRKTKEGEPINLGFRVPPDLISAIDAEVQRMAEDKRGMKLSRSQAVIILLWEALDARARSRGEK